MVPPGRTAISETVRLRLDFIFAKILSRPNLKKTPKQRVREMAPSLTAGAHAISETVRLRLDFIFAKILSRPN